MFNNIALPAVLCVLVVVMDLTLPIHIRQLAGGMFGFGSEDPELFYGRYKQKRIPRLPVGILLALVAGLCRWINAPMYVQMSAVIVTFSVFGAYILLDMFRSRP